MQSAKPIVAEETILALLSDTFGKTAQALTAFDGGQISQVFSFEIDGASYILRFATDGLDAFQKEAFIAKQFASSLVPIPQVVRFGRIENIPYAITEKARGQTLSSLSADEYNQTLPIIIQTGHAIHTTNVEKWNCYGYLDNAGNGQDTSWRAFISSFIDEENTNAYFGKWHTLFDTTFLERTFFDQVYGHVLSLLDYCPEDRYLVHGDFGYDNALAENGEVTAVIDWGGAIYGDFVYDIAYVGFWRPGNALVENYRQYYENQGMDLRNFWKRIACYSCYSGLHAMRFFAKTDNKDAYQATCKILKKIMSNL